MSQIEPSKEHINRAAAVKETSRVLILVKLDPLVIAGSAVENIERANLRVKTMEPELEPEPRTCCMASRQQKQSGNASLLTNKFNARIETAEYVTTATNATTALGMSLPSLPCCERFSCCG